MAIDERSRHDLFTRLEELLGQEHATVLMEHLPPVGWADVATKHDLDQLGAATKHDIDQLGAATKHDIDQLGAATKHDIDQLRTHLGARIGRVEGQLETTEQRLLATLRAEINAQTRTMIFSMATMLIGVAGITLTALSVT